MVLKPREPLPRVGELVVGTIQEVHDFGAYLTLDDYGGIRAFLPWSEIASRMVRNIRAVLKPNQKVVVKVIRVYKSRGQVDVSLKRVTDAERKRKMMWFKRTQKAVMIVKIVAEKIGKSEDDVYREVIWKLEDTYGDAMTGLEQAVIYGAKALEEAGIPEEWIQPLLEEARRHVEVKRVKISGVFTLKSTASDGVHRIRKILIEAREAARQGEVTGIRVYTIGSPHYRIDVQGHDYKELEKAMQAAVDTAEDMASRLEVEFSFERIRE